MEVELREGAVEGNVPAGELSAVELKARMAKPDGKPQLPYRDRAWICNLLDIDWPPVYFEYGQFSISGAGKVNEAKITKLLKAYGVKDSAENRAVVKLEIQNERYAMTLITARISPRDIGEKMRDDVQVGALHIAHDIVRMLNENSGVGDPDNGIAPNVGLFVCETPEPTEAQLELADQTLRKFFEHLVGVADGEFEQYRHSTWIPGLARRAAKWLGSDTSWMLRKGSMVECPYCTTQVLERAVICPNCRNVLRPEEEIALRAQAANAAGRPAHPPEGQGASDPGITHEISTPQEKPKAEKPKKK